MAIQAGLAVASAFAIASRLHLRPCTLDRWGSQVPGCACSTGSAATVFKTASRGAAPRGLRYGRLRQNVPCLSGGNMVQFFSGTHRQQNRKREFYFYSFVRSFVFTSLSRRYSMTSSRLFSLLRSSEFLWLALLMRLRVAKLFLVISVFIFLCVSLVCIVGDMDWLKECC